MSKTMNFYEAMKAVYEGGKAVWNEDAPDFFYKIEGGLIVCWEKENPEDEPHNAYFCDKEISSNWYIYEELAKEYTFKEAFCRENANKKFKLTEYSIVKAGARFKHLSPNYHFFFNFNQQEEARLICGCDCSKTSSYALGFYQLSDLIDLNFIEYKPEDK